MHGATFPLKTTTTCFADVRLSPARRSGPATQGTSTEQAPFVITTARASLGNAGTDASAGRARGAAAAAADATRTHFSTGTLRGSCLKPQPDP